MNLNKKNSRYKKQEKKENYVKIAEKRHYSYEEKLAQANKSSRNSSGSHDSPA